MDYRRIIQESLDYIEDNLKTDITAAELAHRAGFSLYHYYRLFQSAAGLPVMQYILRRRLSHAIFEISSGRTRIDVALEYGFDTYAGFYRAFQREFGCTPSACLEHGRARRPYRINLYQEEPMTVTHKKAAQLLRHWNRQHETITDIYSESSGNRKENAFYIGDSFVLKYTANPGKLQNNISLAKSLENTGLQAPVPVPTVNGEDYVQDGALYFYLSRRLGGQQLSPSRLYQGNSASNARFVGEIIGQLHLALQNADAVVSDANLLETVQSWALPRAKEALTLPETFCRGYLEAFRALYPQLPRQIIHRDPNPSNILLSEDTWGFLDFELSERNVRIYDPCYAATAVLSESFDNCDKEKWLDIFRNLFAGYDAVAYLTEAERQAVPCVLLANQLVCVAWFAEQEKYAELFETNKRMTLWLVEHFPQLQLP